MPWALFYCKLLGAWHQNIGEKAVEWQMNGRKNEIFLEFQNLRIGGWLRYL